MSIHFWTYLPISLVLLVGSASTVTHASDHEERDDSHLTTMPQNQVNDYLAGKGMGLAKAAELNSYPGPLHVLELATQLQLSKEQQQQSEALRQDVKHNARTIGRQIIDKERQLESLFAETTANPENVRRLVKEIGDLKAELRALHLLAHIEQRDLLTAEQIESYDDLRRTQRDTSPRNAHGQSECKCNKGGKGKGKGKGKCKRKAKNH